MIPMRILGVAEFYRQNHALQTVDFVQAKEREYLPLQQGTENNLAGGGVSKLPWSTIAIPIQTCHKSITCCRPQKRFVKMAIHAGSFSPDLSTT